MAMLRQYPTLIRKVAETESTFDALALDAKSQVVYGVVKADPYATPDEIEDASHSWMGAVFKDGEHGDFSASFHPVETGIAPVDFTVGRGVVKKGDWYVGLHVADPATFAQLVRETGLQLIAKDDPTPAASAPIDSDQLASVLSALRAPEIHVHFNEGAFPAAHVEHPVEVHNHVETPQVHNHVNVEAPKPRPVRVETRKGIRRFIPE